MTSSSWITLGSGTIVVAPGSETGCTSAADAIGTAAGGVYAGGGDAGSADAIGGGASAMRGGALMECGTSTAGRVGASRIGSVGGSGMTTAPPIVPIASAGSVVSGGSPSTRGSVCGRTAPVEITYDFSPPDMIASSMCDAPSTPTAKVATPATHRPTCRRWARGVVKRGVIVRGRSAVMYRAPAGSIAAAPAIGRSSSSTAARAFSAAGGNGSMIGACSGRAPSAGGGPSTAGVAGNAASETTAESGDRRTPFRSVG